VEGAAIATTAVSAPRLEMVTECVDDLSSLLEESTLAERKSFIRSFVKEVKVTGDEVLLTYTMPLPPEGISQERVGVLAPSRLYSVLINPELYTYNLIYRFVLVCV